jgi:uncharacterized coiled-coil protein SlyX
MRLTTEQRLIALERDNVVLHDTIKLLHKLLKEQRRLISEYITRRVASSTENPMHNSNQRPEDAVYTFVCSQRFEQIEKLVERVSKMIAKAGSN